MGVLHDGQLSLVRRASAENGCVVVSTFVNPGEFPTLDEASPLHRDEHRDLALLERDGASLVFMPDVSSMYPPDDVTRVTVEGLTRQLEGASRPGHLDGLTTVMLKMLNLVSPPPSTWASGASRSHPAPDDARPVHEHRARRLPAMQSRRAGAVERG
jgi:pantoate--beta-alanine ligase